MKLEKRGRESGDNEDSDVDNYHVKKSNSHYDQEITRLVTAIKGSLESCKVEQMYESFEKINQMELLIDDIEQLHELGFPEIVRDSLDLLGAMISPNDNKDDKGNGSELTGKEFILVKLILNIFLDISEFRDQSQIVNPDINAMKLELLLETGFEKSLLKLIQTIESIYNANMQAYASSLQNDENCFKFMNHEHELLLESILSTYFQLLESTIEIDPKKVSKQLVELDGFFEWMIQILDNDGPSVANELSSLKIELLSIIFQFIKVSEMSNSAILINKKEIMDKFLVNLANFGLRDGEVTEVKEREFVHNIVDIICNFLFEEDFRREFCDLQGLELMVKFMKEKVFMRPLSIKIVSFALLEKGEMNDKFVQLSGLKLIFAFIAHSSKSLVNDEEYIKNRQQQDTDEHLCSIVKSLLRFCTGNDHEKLISQLCEENYLRLKQFLILRRYYSEKISDALANTEDLEDDEAQIDIIETLALDAGLFVVQLIDLITVYVMYYEKVDIDDFEKETLIEYEVRLEDLRTSVEEYSSSIEGDERVFNDQIKEFLNSGQDIQEFDDY
ncbi:hypothetical protein OIY81_1635 [Cryptosporidium canis]|nr:hypothetical protein OIY81_1635 [Cryptosporidium canis]